MVRNSKILPENAGHGKGRSLAKKTPPAAL
jgi:hypothetical protein